MAPKNATRYRGMNMSPLLEEPRQLEKFRPKRATTPAATRVLTAEGRVFPLQQGSPNKAVCRYKAVKITWRDC